MKRSRWIRALADMETVVLPDDDGGWRIIWEGTLCTPTFNSKGAADICLEMYKSGRRQPEL